MIFLSKSTNKHFEPRKKIKQVKKLPHFLNIFFMSLKKYKNAHGYNLNVLSKYFSYIFPDICFDHLCNIYVGEHTHTSKNLISHYESFYLTNPDKICVISKFMSIGLCLSRL